MKNPWITRLAALALATALPLACAAGAPPLRDIVLVHGAFADGSSWQDVIPLLQQKGHRVTAVQNPLTSLADDVAATRRVIARQTGDVLLVGHSWAGAVVTEAGNASKVKGLVYLSALVPDSGESVAALLNRLNAPMEGMKPDADGLIWLDDPKAYAQVMAGDVPRAKVRVLAATQQPMAAAAFEGKVTQAAWRSKPSWYLLTEDDHALSPAVQRRLVEQIGARSLAIKSSHMSMLSHARAVADFIDRAARAARD